MSQNYNDMLLEYYGVRQLPYGNLPEWRDFAFQMHRLYHDRIKQLPWLPKDWASLGTPTLGNNVTLPMLVPSTVTYRKADGTTGRGAKFLDTPEKKKVWDEIAATAQAAHQLYAAGQVEAGRLELKDAYDNIQFWDSAINIANFVAAPVNTLVDVSDFYAKYRGLVSTVVVIGGAVLLYNALRR